MARALISVSDKRGIVEFAKRLQGLGWEIVSTGGTHHALSAGGISAIPVEDVTGFPEILDGRVKTLHPAVHAGLLARRSVPNHLATLKEHGLVPFDLLAVNLYPFRETIAKPDMKFEDAIEQIDIGGPAMLRAAAKNHASVLPVVDPRDYDRVMQAIRTRKIDYSLRRELAAKVYSHTAGYDAAVAAYLGQDTDIFPPVVSLVLERRQELRYGENPLQRAALYTTREDRGVEVMKQLHGKELSFNNIMDIESASLAVSPWPDRPACAVIKHTTPCGIAIGQTAEEAYRRALATDPKSAFGSVVGFNTVVDANAAKQMLDLFIEVIVAPRFHDDALTILRSKKNLRLIELPLSEGPRSFDFKRVRGGFLVQDQFVFSTDETNWRVATKREPTPEELRDLRFAWAAVSSVKSNAILLARNEAAIGIGAGQMSRVDSTHIAVRKAGEASHEIPGAALGSDAFFPFADGIEQAAEAGVTSIIQPGGSVRDDEVTSAADAHGVAMILTGVRLFRH